MTVQTKELSLIEWPIPASNPAIWTFICLRSQAGRRGGASPRLLIDSDFMEDQAAFSPDGKSIVFVSTFSGNADIYRLPFRPDRTSTMKQAENLTHYPSGDFRPAISPDGRMMAFSSDRDLPVTARGPITRHRSGERFVDEIERPGSPL